MNFQQILVAQEFQNKSTILQMFSILINVIDLFNTELIYSCLHIYLD